MMMQLLVKKNTSQSIVPLGIDGDSAFCFLNHDVGPTGCSLVGAQHLGTTHE
jgi:hypothetical protein